MRKTLFLLSSLVLLILSIGTWLPGHGNYFTHTDEVLRGFVSVIWFWMLYTALGWKTVHRWFLTPDSSSSEKGFFQIISPLLLSAGIGMGIYTALLLIFGIWIGVSQTKIILFNFAAALAAGNSWIGVWNQVTASLKRLQARSWSRPEMLSLIFFAFLSLSLLPFVMTPALFPDTLRYHFGLTKLYLDSGRVDFYPDMAESNISLNWQFLYMGQLLTSGELCPQIFNGSVLLLILVAAAAATSPGARLWTAGLIFSFPFMLSLTGITNNDLGVAWFGALLWLVLRRNEFKHSWLLSGLLAGLAFGVKYSEGTAFAGLFIAVIVVHSASAKMKFQISALIILGFILGFSPWWIKNTLWTGDPLYPSLSHYLPWASPEGVHVTETYQPELERYGGGMHGLRRWALGVWRATTENSQYFESEMGFSLILLIPLFVWSYWALPSLRLESLSALIFIALWSAGPQITRFISAGVPILAIAGGEILHQIRETKLSKWIRSSVGILVPFSLWTSWLTLADFSNPYFYFLKRNSKENYLLKYSPTYPAVKWLIQNGHTQEKVLLFGVEDVSIFPNPLQYSGPFNTKWIVNQSEEAASPAELAERVLKNGVYYLYTDRIQAGALDKKFGYLSWPDREAEERFKDFFNNYTRLIQKDDTGHSFRELREVLIPTPSS